VIAVVMGLRRSGSSLVSQLLHELGVVMGETFLQTLPDWNPDGFYEDAEFVAVADRVVAATRQVNDGRVVALWDARPLEDLKALIRRRSERYPNWGLKNFALAYLFHEFAAHCPEPVRLVVTLRSFAESVFSYCRAARERPDQVVPRFGHDLVNVEMTLKTYAGPTLEVSYDRLLERPAEAVRELADFCGVPFREEVVGLVRPERRRFGPAKPARRDSPHSPLPNPCAARPAARAGGEHEEALEVAGGR
jgi:hypothetical protein